MSVEPKTCFVLMPFSKTIAEHTDDYWTAHFEDFLKPMIEEMDGIKAVRSEAIRGDILEAIINHLVYDPIVVADLTDFNPNVFWELGVRQSFKHGTITIMEGPPARIPFDLGRKSVLFYYSKNIVKNLEFKKSFHSALKECLSSPSPDSAVLQIITGRGTVFQTINREQNLRRLDGLIAVHGRNESILLEIYETINWNKKNPDNWKTVTSNFLTNPADLLSSNRYLDEDETFYSTIERYVEDIVAFNAQLPLWESNKEYTERWFLTEKSEEETTFKRFRVIVNQAKEKLERSV